MVNDVDEALAEMLVNELREMPGCVIRERNQITFHPPAFEADKGAHPTINLFLHEIHENTNLREETFLRSQKPGEQTIGIRRSPIRLELSYLLTVRAGNDASAEHRLLSEVLHVLMRHATIPGPYLKGLLSAQSGLIPLLSVAQPTSAGFSEPPATWRALGGDTKPTVRVVVTAPFDPFETRWTKIVKEAIIGLGQGVPKAEAIQQRTISVSIAGIVADRNSPDAGLTEVQVCANPGDRTTVTDDRGLFFFTNLPEGEYSLTFQRAGFESVQSSARAVPAGKSHQVEPMVVVMDRAYFAPQTQIEKPKTRGR